MVLTAFVWLLIEFLKTVCGHRNTTKGCCYSFGFSANICHTFQFLRNKIWSLFFCEKTSCFFSVVHKTSLQRAQDMRIEDIFRMSRILPTKTRLDVLHVHLFIKKCSLQTVYSFGKSCYLFCFNLGLFERRILVL